MLISGSNCRCYVIYSVSIPRHFVFNTYWKRYVHCVKSHTLRIFSRIHGHAYIGISEQDILTFLISVNLYSQMQCTEIFQFLNVIYLFTGMRKKTIRFVVRQIWNVKNQLRSKQNAINKNIRTTSTYMFSRRKYQNINLVLRWQESPEVVMTPYAIGIGWHKPPGISCHIGANILICIPQSHVIYVCYKISACEN